MWPLFGAMISNVCSCANRVQSAPPTPAKPEEDKARGRGGRAVARTGSCDIGGSARFS